MTSSSINACVPTTSFSSPVASLPSKSARRRAGVEPLSRADGSNPSGTSVCSVSKCCSASVSVGAINAPCIPCSTARSSAYSATTVLPEPTSPISRRCIGRVRARSTSIAAIAELWSAVSANGSRSSNQRAVSSRAPASATAVPEPRSARRRSSANCINNSSSNASRARPASASSPLREKCIAASAAARSGRHSAARIRAGSGSATSASASRCSRTSAAICVELTPTVAG